MKQTKKGPATVGLDLNARVAWLGEFVRADLSTLRSRQRAARELTQLLYVEFVSDGPIEVEPQEQVKAAAVESIQSVIRTLLQGLVPGQWIYLDQPPLDLSGIGTSLRWDANRGIVLGTRTKGIVQIVSAVVSALMSAGANLRRCRTADCARLFVATRRGQTRCVKTCGGSARVREWRRQNPERDTETRHKQYSKKVTRRLPGARVERRPRRGSSST